MIKIMDTEVNNVTKQASSNRIKPLDLKRINPFFFGFQIQIQFQTQPLVDQRPVDPWTAQFGGGLQFGRRWEAVLEVGSNFKDATIVVASAAFRF